MTTDYVGKGVPFIPFVLSDKFRGTVEHNEFEVTETLVENDLNVFVFRWERPAIEHAYHDGSDLSTSDPVTSSHLDRGISGR
jgi:hypothetical protein